MEDEKDPNKKLDESALDKILEKFDQQVTPQYLYKLAKVKLAERIKKGETGLFEEFKKLKELESLINAPAEPAAGLATAPSSPVRPTGGEGAPASGAGKDEEIGLPERFRVKRHYSWSKEAQEQRRKAAQARRPGSEGNKRNWKGGLFAKDFIQGRIKPCLSTCPIFDECELVSEGYTQPGKECLDKQAVIQTYSALMDAIKGTGPDRYDDFNSVSALTIAETLHVYRRMLEDVMREGPYIKREKYDKEGRLQVIEYVPHPNLMAIPKLYADIGLNPNTMMATPKAIKDDKNAEDANETFGKILGRVGKMIKQSEEQKKPEERE